MLYTGANLPTADAIADGMFTTPTSPPNPAQAAGAFAQFGAALSQGVFAGNVFPQLGFNLSTAQNQGSSGYIDPAFIGGRVRCTRRPSSSSNTSHHTEHQQPGAQLLCRHPHAAAVGRVSSACLVPGRQRDEQRRRVQRHLQLHAGGAPAQRLHRRRQPAALLRVWRGALGCILSGLHEPPTCVLQYLPSQDAGCGYTTPQQYAQAWDFQTTTNSAYNISMYYNNSDLPYENQQPFRLQRVNAVRRGMHTVCCMCKLSCAPSPRASTWRSTGGCGGPSGRWRPPPCTACRPSPRSKPSTLLTLPRSWGPSFTPGSWRCCSPSSCTARCTKKPTACAS